MEKYILNDSTTVKDAMKQLELTRGVGLIIVNDAKELVGSLTDGDIRRGIIAGASIDSPVKDLMFKEPTSADSSVPDSELFKIINDHGVKILPILKNKEVVNVFLAEGEQKLEVPVILMAGGLGSRLGEHTKETPKPMLKIGGKPILERILENFTRVGFHKFFFSVNYKAEIIENFFEKGEKHNCSISYVKEKKRLGTAGSLSLLPESISGPVIVMNGDLLTHVNFSELLSFHNKHDSPITMCTREFDIQVPYGVINIEEGMAASFDEKPTHSFNVNAGVYVIDSSLFKYIPQDEYFDMSSYLNLLIENNIFAQCFPLIEKWIDIGQVADLNYARKQYAETE